MRFLKISLGGILAGLSGGLAAGIFVLSAGEMYMPNGVKVFFAVGNLPYLLISAAACGLISGVVVGGLEMIVPAYLIMPAAVIVGTSVGGFVHSRIHARLVAANMSNAEYQMLFFHFGLVAGAVAGVAIYLSVRRLQKTDR